MSDYKVLKSWPKLLRGGHIPRSSRNMAKEHVCKVKNRLCFFQCTIVVALNTDIVGVPTKGKVPTYKERNYCYFMLHLKFAFNCVNIVHTCMQVSQMVMHDLHIFTSKPNGSVIVTISHKGSMSCRQNCIK